MPSLLPSGSSRPTGSVSSQSFWVGLVLAAGAIALSVVGFSVQDAAPVTSDVRGVGDPSIVSVQASVATLELAGTIEQHVDPALNPLHHLEVTSHEGRRVYRIRATSYGDEILIDYITGKLITVRALPNKFTVPPPMGESIVSSS